MEYTKPIVCAVLILGLMLVYGISRPEVNKLVVSLAVTLGNKNSSLTNKAIYTNKTTVDWKLKESTELSTILQNRLHYLQNPVNCSTARKVVCNMDRPSGFGSMLRDISFCLHLAYATKRTLILDSSKWIYAPHKWEKVFQPLSETCTDPKGLSSKVWEGNIDKIQVVILPRTAHANAFPRPRPSFLPQAIPKDLAPRIQKFHNFPFLWWQGQLLKYVLRPGDKLKTFINITYKSLHFRRPIVGVQVRRTDKKREASYHQLSEYMVHVEKYFERHFPGQSKLEKNIYLATDEPSILGELRKKYPQYSVIHDQDFTKSASLSRRLSEESLYGIIADLHFLSLSDYLVCTFSSNVGRRAYELMQTLNIDASNQTKSLDGYYSFHGQQANTHKAVEDHIPSKHDDLQLQVGDNVKPKRDFRNGRCLGRNLRTNKEGIYPCHKAIRNVLVEDFPDYSEADLILQNKTAL